MLGGSWIEALAGLVGAFLRKGSTQSTPRPLWLSLAEHELGFHERGTNQGIERYTQAAHCGAEGDPWCAIFANAMIENSGHIGTRSAMARSFERHPNFVELSGPALGAIVTNWRNSRTGGLGHVFFYTGHDIQGRVWGIGGNEDDGVRKVPHRPDHVVGYFWPAYMPMPTICRVPVSSGGAALFSTKEV